MPWNEIQPERVPDRETVSFRFHVLGGFMGEAWERSVETHTHLVIAVGSMQEEVAHLGPTRDPVVHKTPQWRSDGWLTSGTLPYRGGAEKELIATGRIGHSGVAALDEPGAQVWVMLNFHWTLAGSLVATVDDPEWTATAPRMFSEHAPPLTILEPGVQPLRLAWVARVWRRDDPQELWFSGHYGWGWHLHSYIVEESPDTVRLTCLVGKTGESLAWERNAREAGIETVTPMVKRRWVARQTLAVPLADRKVYFRTDEPSFRAERTSRGPRPLSGLGDSNHEGSL